MDTVLDKYHDEDEFETEGDKDILQEVLSTIRYELRCGIEAIDDPKERKMLRAIQKSVRDIVREYKK